MYEEDKDRNWNREPEEERPKKGGILKKAAWITAGALLFGTIAGGVMVGVQIASSGVFKNLYAIVSGEPEAGDWKAPEGQKPPADPFAGSETRRRLISLLRLQMCLSSWRKQCLR